TWATHFLLGRNQIPDQFPRCVGEFVKLCHAGLQPIMAATLPLPTFRTKPSTAGQINSAFVLTDYLTARAIPAFETSQRYCLQAIERKVVSNGLTFNNSFSHAPDAALDQVNRESSYPTLKSYIPIFIGPSKAWFTYQRFKSNPQML
ncbi:Secretory lipase, partial [Pseudomonas coronafaciens pv. zizaniae]